MSTRVPLLACIAVLSFFAGITGVRLAYTLTYILVVLLVVAFWWSRSVARRLRVRRESPTDNAVVGQAFVERFVVENGSLFPVAYCEVSDLSALSGYRAGRVFALPGGGKVTWTARGTFERRGRHSFGPLEARLGDPFGLFPRTLRATPHSEVIVYPAIHALDNVVPAWAGTTPGQLGGVPADVPPDTSTVREYDP
ncbi:MAG TPA: hypothetical protein VE219_04255, partial [Candidatus Sulfotelmatobacter sp.]|nr:hypothetical protein [Candidatus Sulfotelmatobacter sp.]